MSTTDNITEAAQKALDHREEDKLMSTKEKDKLKPTIDEITKAAKQALKDGNKLVLLVLHDNGEIDRYRFPATSPRCPNSIACNQPLNLPSGNMKYVKSITVTTFQASPIQHVVCGPNIHGQWECDPPF